MYGHQGGKAAGGGGGGVMNWVIGIDMYALMCIKLMTNKNLLCKKINKIKFKKKKSCHAPAFILWSHEVCLSSNLESYLYQIETSSYVLISKHYSINKDLY